jgi:hypothetical protein
MIKNIAALVISLQFMVYSGANASAQCDQCNLPVEGKVTLRYSGGWAIVPLTDTQAKKLVGFGQNVYDPLYRSGQVHTSLFKKWVLIETASVENFNATMMAVAEDGKDIRVFQLKPRNQAQGQTIADRISKRDLDSFNILLRSEGVQINDPLQAYETSLLFLKLATHRVQKFFIEPLVTGSDIPLPNDVTRRFSGIQSAFENEEARKKFRVEIEHLSRKLDSPKYAKVGRQYKLSFFTWDAAFGRVEEWCFTISHSGIVDITQKLVIDRV